MNPPPLVVVVLAAGRGTRFGAASPPKQLHPLRGVPVLAHTLRRVGAARPDRVVVVTADDLVQVVEDLCSEHLAAPWSVVVGGAQRNDSVARAVAAIDEPDARVIVHDGVRPLVPPALIRTVADTLAQADAVLPVVPSVDRLVRVDGDRVVGFGDAVVRGQSPGGFRLSDLRSALAELEPRGPLPFGTVFDLLLAARPEARIVTVPGDPTNVKITLPHDLLLAEALLGRDEP